MALLGVWKHSVRDRVDSPEDSLWLMLKTTVNVVADAALMAYGPQRDRYWEIEIVEVHRAAGRKQLRFPTQECLALERIALASTVVWNQIIIGYLPAKHQSSHKSPNPVAVENDGRRQELEGPWRLVGTRSQ